MSYGMAQNLEENSVSCRVLFRFGENISGGQLVKRTERSFRFRSEKVLIGRVVNALQPIDGAGPITAARVPSDLESPALGICERKGVNRPLQTGIKARRFHAWFRSEESAS